MLRILLLFSGLLITVVITIYSLGYHGDREFGSGNELPTKEMLIKNANKLKGAPYDPLMGMHGNIGAKFGFMVCSDVPNIAYGLSGYSIKNALAQDYAEHPSAYNAKGKNNPQNPYFHRRARNLYAYFKSTGRLMPKGYKPSVGDLAFYKKSEKGYISHVALVSEVTTNNYMLIESAPKTIFVQEVSGSSPTQRGWILVGYGKVY